MTGDLNISADGTVTHVDGKQIYAFGHRFLTTGTTDLPRACPPRSSRCFPVRIRRSRFSAPRELVGSWSATEVPPFGVRLGGRTHAAPGGDNDRAIGLHRYNIRLVNDRLLTPFLTQMALFSVLDSTERMAGAGSLRVDGELSSKGTFRHSISEFFFRGFECRAQRP